MFECNKKQQLGYKYTILLPVVAIGILIPIVTTGQYKYVLKFKNDLHTSKNQTVSLILIMPNFISRVFELLTLD